MLVAYHNFSPSFFQQNHPDPISRPGLFEYILAMMIDRNVVVYNYLNSLLNAACQTKIHDIKPLLRYFGICEHFVD